MIRRVRPQWQTISGLHRQSFSKLNIQNLGTQMEHFRGLRRSFENLPIDPYRQDQPPTRFRRYQKYHVNTSNPDVFAFQLSDQYQFHQEVDDFRNQTRFFSPIERHVQDEHFYYLLGQVVALTLFHQPNIIHLDLSVHQVRLLSYPDNDADNAPEGIHQDGADFIISAMVFNKHNISNDNSIIYNPDLQAIYQTQLNEGEFIFQDDRKLWHDITPIRAQPRFIGYRDILGFDLNISE